MRVLSETQDNTVVMKQMTNDGVYTINNLTDRQAKSHLNIPVFQAKKRVTLYTVYIKY